LLYFVQFAYRDRKLSLSLCVFVRHFSSGITLKRIPTLAGPAEGTKACVDLLISHALIMSVTCNSAINGSMQHVNFGTTCQVNAITCHADG
jgi:hypothetical protein